MIKFMNANERKECRCVYCLKEPIYEMSTNEVDYIPFDITQGNIYVCKPCALQHFNGGR